MALIQCPDCGKDISDQAPACIHCGYPVDQKKQAIYALVLYEEDYNDANILQNIQRATGQTGDEAALLRLQVPVVLKRGLDFDACVVLTHIFSKRTVLGIIRDTDVDDLANAQRIPYQPDPPARSPLSFWGVVGAVVVGIIAVVLLLSFL